MIQCAYVKKYTKTDAILNGFHVLFHRFCVYTRVCEQSFQQPWLQTTLPPPLRMVLLRTMPKKASRHQAKSKVASRNSKKNAKNAKSATPRSAGAKRVSAGAAATPSVNVVRTCELRGRVLRR